jgi:DNA-binding winged helix-turn-helix (wHTH) protein
MSEQNQQIYGFESFRLDVPNRRLLREGVPVLLQAKAFDLLVVLIENGGQLIGKDELFSRVWPNQIVEESNLTVQVSAIRRALGDHKDDPHYIITVPGHGYRFASKVRRLNGAEGVSREALAISHYCRSGAETAAAHENLLHPAAHRSRSEATVGAGARATIRTQFKTGRNRRTAANAEVLVGERERRHQERCHFWRSGDRNRRGGLSLASPQGPEPGNPFHRHSALHGGGADQAEYLSDGLTESLINSLSKHLICASRLARPRSVSGAVS